MRWFAFSSLSFPAKAIAGNRTVELSGPITVGFPAQKDNTLYEDPAGQLSNGWGPYFFAGRTSGNLLRRGLIAFDLSSIPTDATITGGNLRMRVVGGGAEVSLYKASRTWGEGSSNAGDPGGDGNQAAPNDATWLHNFYNTSFWTTPGGDFSLTPSATANVFISGTFVWSGAALRADLQDWVSNPGNNFGWVVRSDETTAGEIQRFYSREQLNNNRPFLTVTYESPSQTPPPSAFGNISTRLRVLNGDNVLIGGFIITGTVEKRVILRAIGPSLSDFGVPGALADPTLELYEGNTLLASNDNWREPSQNEIEVLATGIAPTNHLESALVRTLAPGAYTAIVRGVNGATGIGIVEAYDMNLGAASKLGNISTRGFVDVDDNVMIAGLIVLPNDGANLRILARALGPTLSDLGVPNALADTTLDLVNSDGAVIRSNNNWQDDPQQRAEIEAAGLAPNHLEKRPW